MKFTALILLFPLLFFSCSEKKNSTFNEPEIVKIDSLDLQPFMDFDSHGIVYPGDMAVMNNGNIIVADGSLKKVFIISKEGEEIAKFGNEGRGPGEFIYPSQIVLTERLINIVDQRQHKVLEFDQDGNFIDSYKYKFTNSFGSELSILEGRKLFAGAGGFDNHLLLFNNINTDSTFYFGSAMGENIETVDFAKASDAVKKGEIPDFLKNMAIIRSNGEFVYAFLESYSILQKYKLNGSLIWERKIDLPDNQLLLEQVSKRAKNASSGNIPIVRYSLDMNLVNDEIYILANNIAENPQYLVKINSDGEIETMYEFPNSLGTVWNFAIDTAINTLYFSGIDASIFKTPISE